MNSVNPKDKKSTISLPWLDWRIGDRVVLRRREHDGFYDALGYLVEKTPHYVVIQTRKGNVKVPAEKWLLVKKFHHHLVLNKYLHNKHIS